MINSRTFESEGGIGIWVASQHVRTPSVKISMIGLMPTPWWKIGNGRVLVIDSHIVQGISTLNNEKCEEESQSEDYLHNQWV